MFVSEQKIPELKLIENEKDWNEALADEKNPLFKINRNPKPLTGPRISGPKVMSGDLFFMEETAFYGCATPNQQEFYDLLKKINPIKAKQYLLTIIDALDLWKKDMEIIEETLRALNQESSSINKEIEQLLEKLNYAEKMNIPKALKKHIPEHMFDIDITEEHVKGASSVLTAAIINQLEPKRRYLQDFLEIKKKDMPFLFN